MDQTPTRRRGRPLGSKNKRRKLSILAVHEQCDRAKHNPVKFWIDVAQGKHERFNDDGDVKYANKLLFDAVQGDRKLMSNAVDTTQGQHEAQYEIVFNEEPASVTLQGQAHTIGTEASDGSEPVQRIGVSQAHGQNGLCD